MERGKGRWHIRIEYFTDRQAKDGKAGSKDKTAHLMDRAGALDSDSFFLLLYSKLSIN
jgi:hypothetical protein